MHGLQVELHGRALAWHSPGTMFGYKQHHRIAKTPNRTRTYCLQVQHLWLVCQCFSTLLGIGKLDNSSSLSRGGRDKGAKPGKSSLFGSREGQELRPSVAGSGRRAMRISSYRYPFHLPFTRLYLFLFSKKRLQFFPIILLRVQKT